MRATRTFLSTGGFLLLATLGPALALDTTACSKDPVPAASQDPIQVGVSVALSGTYKGTGAGLLQGIQAAADVINARGGVLGRPIQLVIQDDQSSNPDLDNSVRLTSVVNGFLGQKVSAILGPGSSVQVLAAQPLAVAAKTLMITSWATSPDLTALQPWPARYLYRTPPSDFYQRAALYKRMMDALPATTDGGTGTPAPCTRPFLVYGDDSLGTTYANYFRDVKGIPAQYLKAVSTNYKSPMNIAGAYAAAPSTPDCVAMVTYADVSAHVVTELNAAKITPKYFATDPAFDQGFLTGVGNNALVEGLAGVEPDTAPNTPDYRAFRNIFQAQTVPSGGALVEPPPYSSNAFDSMILLAFAIQKAGPGADSTAIRDALVRVSRGYPAGVGPEGRQFNTITPSTIDDGFNALLNGSDINYEGASGSVDFDQNGDVSAGFVKWDIRSGQFVVQTGDTSRYTAAELAQ